MLITIGGRAFRVVNGIDRAIAWFDRADIPISFKLLRPHCRRLKLTVGQMHKNACWKLKMSVHQPSRRFFEILLVALGQDVRVLITYVEIARDVLAGDRSARLMRELLASVLVPRLHSSSVTIYKGTAYLSPRTDKKGKPRPNVPVVYADKPSKLPRQGVDVRRVLTPEMSPCLHIEWRCNGSESMRAVGIASISDLFLFDFDAFWSSHLQLLKLPEQKTELGRVLPGKRATDDGYLKRANRFIARHTDKAGRFLMHDAVRSMPVRFRKKLEVLTFEQWLIEAMRSRQ